MHSYFLSVSSSTKKKIRLQYKVLSFTAIDSQIIYNTDIYEDVEKSRMDRIKDNFTRDACRMKISELSDEVTFRETAIDSQIIYNTDIYEDVEKSRMDRIKDNNYNVIKDATCKDRNLIYALICNRCAKTVYVGETERTLKERTTEHKRDIKFQKDKPIMRHFRNHEEKDLSVAILTRTVGENKIYRLISEEKWIKTLQTGFPHGCNVKINL